MCLLLVSRTDNFQFAAALSDARKWLRKVGDVEDIIEDGQDFGPGFSDAEIAESPSRKKLYSAGLTISVPGVSVEEMSAYLEQPTDLDLKPTARRLRSIDLAGLRASLNNRLRKILDTEDSDPIEVTKAQLDQYLKTRVV